MGDEASASRRTDPYDGRHQAVSEAATALRGRTGLEAFDVALVMGSGWVGAADVIGEVLAEFPMTDLPGFAAPVVAGHGGTIRVESRGSDRGLRVGRHRNRVVP